MTIALFLLILAATLSWGGWLAQRFARVGRRIDADVAFLQSIPSDMDWGQR